MISPIEGKNLFLIRASSESSARRPCYQTSVLRGRDSAEAAGRDLPVGFGNGLVVTHGHQEHIFGYHIKSPSMMLTERVLKIIV